MQFGLFNLCKEKIMNNKIIYRHTVRNKGGESAGETIEKLVPDFDWDEFKNLPLARVFAKKAYFEEIKKIMREIEEGNKNQTVESDLQSMESVISRSLKFTKKEITDWFDERNFSEFKKLNNTKAREELKSLFLDCSKGSIVFEKKQRDKYANIIAKVADKPTDDIADYLFSRFSFESEFDEIDL